MAILSNSNAISSGAYPINNSLRFRSSASAYLARTMSASGTTATWSFWVKRGKLGGSIQSLFDWTDGVSTSFGIEFTAADTIDFYNFLMSYTMRLVTTQVFRDPSAWYHLVAVIDTTNATASERARLYVNGQRITALATATYPTQNLAMNISTARAFDIGATGATNTQLFDGYFAEFNFIDGQALTPSSFGATDATTGVWQPAKYTGTYGTNGFYLKFSDIATTSGSNAGLGKDFSGNSNYWTTNNISVTSGTTYDAMTDSPTNTSATVANYCVMNPINSNATISGGNLAITYASTVQTKNVGTMSIVGKTYFEVTFGSQVGTNNSYFGVGSNSSYAAYNSANPLGYDSFAWAIGTNNVDVGKRNNNVYTSLASGASSTGDIFMIATDPINGKIWFGKNGTWYGSGDPVAGTNAAFTGLPSEIFPIIDLYGSSGSQTVNVNFGQRPFSYTPPTGFNRLNTFNLPTPTILQGNKYMDATLYTGNGTSQTITTASSFKPDLVWIKGRSYADFHTWFDTVRGATKSISSDLTTAEVTRGTALTAFTSTGFTVGSDTLVNYNGQTTVAWQWQAGQGSTSSNTSGSITSTVSVNASAGFSIVTYTGTGANATVGHGLGVAPKMVIVKRRTVSPSNWVVWHGSIPNTDYILLNSTAAKATLASVWNSTSPTSSVFSVGTDNDTNGSTNTIVAYCWADVSGYSKAFSYTANGSTDGPMVYLGFRPKFIMLKNASSSSVDAVWTIIDSTRSTYNQAILYLIPNLSNAEASSTGIATDFLSNGFKVRNVSTAMNATAGHTIVGMAFAENPFKNSNAF